MTKNKMEENLKNFIPIVNAVIKNINKPIVVEIGARDCRETILFNKEIENSIIYTFECNPKTLPICREAIKDTSNIHLIEKAVSEKDGTVFFYPTNKNTITTWGDGNPGASSLFLASGKYPVEKYAQDKIRITSTRLDSFMEENKIPRIDILWMDIQGAELLALKSAGKNISKIKLIHLEVEFIEIYERQPLFKEIKSWLNENDFIFIGFTSIGKYSGDAIFINKNTNIPKIKYIIYYRYLNAVSLLNKISKKVFSLIFNYDKSRKQ